MLFSFCIAGCICNPKANNNSNWEKDDTSSIDSMYQVGESVSIKARKDAPTSKDIKFFLNHRDEEGSYSRLSFKFKFADICEECLLYSLIAAGKFNIPEANYDIAAYLTDYFTITDLGKHSKDLAIHFFAKVKKDEFLSSQLKHFMAMKDEGKMLHGVDSKRHSSDIWFLKSETLKGSTENYKKLKEEMYSRGEEDLLLFYSYIMADRYNYAPARNDVKDIINNAYTKYDLGGIDQEVLYFIKSL